MAMCKDGVVFLSGPLASRPCEPDAQGRRIDGVGAIVCPYGAARYSDGAMPTAYGFTGQRFDTTTGLMDYGARYYDPMSGRFISADSVSTNTTGDDPYAYVADNPETMTDPTGHLLLDNGDGNTIIYRAHHPESGQSTPPVADDYPTTGGSSGRVQLYLLVQ